MPKKCSNSDDSSCELARKKVAQIGPTVNLRQGVILTDTNGKKWKLGKCIGVGGFGKIYIVSDSIHEEVRDDAVYVAKIENHSNGPLFVEMNCYLRIAKEEMINEWQIENGMENLGMPHYVASGSHKYNNAKYRFLILPRYRSDLESVLQSRKKLNMKTVVTISIQIMDVLRYIHDKGYIHSDVKASNILLGKTSPKKRFAASHKISRYRDIPVRSCRPRKMKSPKNLRPHKIVHYLDDIPDFDLLTSGDVGKISEKVEKDQVYLLDYGLAAKYLSNKKHKEYCCDERKAHAGTILFCSRDAHEGVQSRRSDLECLGYNIIYWLTGSLPWIADVDDPELVKKKKRKCWDNLKGFLYLCFSDYPKFLLEYFLYLQSLKFSDKPDYMYCKSLFKTVFKDYGYKDNCKFDFDNLEGWGEKQIKLKKRAQENKVHSVVCKFTRIPLMSNSPIIKPKLRQKSKNKKFNAKMNWSKILIDPEIMLKQQRKVSCKKVPELSENNLEKNILNMEIWNLNPTYAMIEVFNKCQERQFNSSPNHKTEDFTNAVEGYTPAMLSVYHRMKEREEMERAVVERASKKRLKAVKKLSARSKKKPYPCLKTERYMFRNNRQHMTNG